MKTCTGHFTLPGESGCEQLTLDLARRWDADVIRDSDGTRLSPEIVSSGYRIYSTLCPIREHNPFLREHPECRQQSFLSTPPVTASADQTEIALMDGFFAEQFQVNESPEALEYLEVWDRTENVRVERDKVSYADGRVSFPSVPFREYTVSFLAWRIWEEISMYNHVTNHWDKEHLMVLDPYLPQAREYLTEWMKNWLDAHPDTNVVRFTSLFYNFTWIWGSSKLNRNLFTDWASYDFTVSPAALKDFEKEYGYALSAEDFVRKGKYNATHIPPTEHKKDWMDFVGRFVRKLGRNLTDMTHAYGKEAYVFYDDSWVGLEPWNGHFEEMGFDGIIKCVFSGFEVRLCAGVPAKTHEIRFHPYLFPVGLGGAPTFSPGGKPGRDALEYWVRVRRAMLRQKIDRTGLGGYLHLVPDYPDFTEAMDRILHEFRLISSLHDTGKPMGSGVGIGVLTSWGSLRSWTLSGHFHETYMHPLIHVIESLSGLPHDVRFLSFDDIRNGVPEGIDVLINCGWEGTAWSGGDAWRDGKILESISAFALRGGTVIGIAEPSCAPDGFRSFRLSNVLGVDRDDAAYSCHGSFAVSLTEMPGIRPDESGLGKTVPVRIIDPGVQVLWQEQGMPVITCHPFGKGRGIYLAGYSYSPANTALLDRLITNGKSLNLPHADDPRAECAYYPGESILAVANSSPDPLTVHVSFEGRTYAVVLDGSEMKTLDLSSGAGL